MHKQTPCDRSSDQARVGIVNCTAEMWELLTHIFQSEFQKEGKHEDLHELVTNLVSPDLHELYMHVTIYL